MVRRWCASRALPAAVGVLRSAHESYGRHACSELAAAIAYRVLFALVPSIALLAALLDASCPRTARAAVVDWLLGALPGTTVRDRRRAGAREDGRDHVADRDDRLRRPVDGQRDDPVAARRARGHLGADQRPAFVRAKLRDIAVLGVLAALLLAVFPLSLTRSRRPGRRRPQRRAGLRWRGAISPRAAELTSSPPPRSPRCCSCTGMGAPAALPLKVWRGRRRRPRDRRGLAGYAFYLVNIAGFDTIYGPLGALLALLALLYMAALVLFGAELVAALTPAQPPHPKRMMRGASAPEQVRP